MPDAYLLSPYRPPTSYPVSLDAPEASAWLRGYFSLWHPAVLARIDAPPRAASGYDHDQPHAGAVYCTPQGPEVYHPDDWNYRVREAGGVEYTATESAEETAAKLREALGDAPRADASPELVARLAAIGFGYLLIDGLFEAADHDRLLDAEGFWTDVQNAIAEPDRSEAHLSEAANKLLSAREALNPSGLHLIDVIYPHADRLDAPWPASVSAGLPATVVAPSSLLELMSTASPGQFAELHGATERVEIATGGVSDRDDALLPPESQHAALAQARRTIDSLFGVKLVTFARERTSAHLDTPAFLRRAGFKYALLTPRPGADFPGADAAVVNWPSPDGKTIDAIGRAAQPAGDPLTFFNLTHTLHAALGKDSAPLLLIAHDGTPAAAGYAELVALAQLGGALGEFTTPSAYLGSHHYGEYLGTSSADDFRVDLLDDRATRRVADPVSAFARHRRLRQRLDAALAFQGVLRTLADPTDADHKLLARLETLEAQLERDAPDSAFDLATLESAERESRQRLAERLSAKGEAGRSGFLVLNPSAVARRVGLEIPNVTGVIPLGGAVKASEFDAGTAYVVVELPSLGFAWLPRPTGQTQAKSRGKTAEGHAVRNEFLEAELDPQTGGLRAVRDLRSRQTRVGMQLIYAPGSVCRARHIEVTHAGPALGEVTAEGDILTEDDGHPIATFRTILRAWAGRPAVELTVELHPITPPQGYAWADHFAARFGWRDDRASLYRGVNGHPHRAQVSKLDAPDYLEIRLGPERTAIFTAGLAFWQTAGSRAADCVLACAHESANRFEFLVTLDRDYPTPAAASWTAPAPVIPVETGPPGGLASSPLVTLDLPSLHLSGFRPRGEGRAVVLDLTETAGFGGAADLAFGHPPASAVLLDNDDEPQEITVNGQVVPVEFSAGESLRVAVEWMSL